MTSDGPGTTTSPGLRIPTPRPAAEPEPGGARAERLLVPGETCWRIERADRYAVFVDAAGYFAALKKAVLGARRRVLLIGWDFDPRVRLDPGSGGRARDDRLGRVLEAAVRANPQLDIGVLAWDLGQVYGLARGMLPIALLGRRTPDRLTFAVDTHHPVGGAHHQKIVVIDDCLAFAGGIDVTADRWDTSEHPDHSRARARPGSHRDMGPWHDVTSLVSGPAARAIGDLARERWESGKGEHLEPVTGEEPCWPEGVEPLLTDVDVAVSRTRPEHGGTSLIHEIELLWLAVIAGARHTVYIETQYFANRRVAEAIAERLKEPDGPEVVVLNPHEAWGWLEEKAMGTARATLLDMVREADRHDRFRLYVPVTESRRPIYVHAKVTVVDDRLLRIGSSNLNNRSMGLDTECDLSIEVADDAPDREALAATVLGMRDRLLGEHLDVAPEEVAAAVERAGGSLIAAIEELRRPSGRSLVPFDPPDLGAVGKVLADTQLLDAERTPDRWQRIRGAFGHRRAHRPLRG
ncbi:phospholipase D-like domain-containing protein [Trujillonella endophytica]|uniref:Phosphatidylserine/phosphatidylglycerophosphate/cardiolipin synthase n=1 Tax=Trujillonella endophytica TaxID=673521 RepID=A0A1H8PXN2_9ACTN|nr:phospholipase D-like domain-containing protein [Trujillella endophytica]SEO46444.1 Phosphatidylserine/phosphatidylglycerophosphate/cardiolipin synthase [Trujillella endophytica]